MPGLSHVSLATGTNNYKSMRTLYTKILAPVGYKVFMEEDGVFLGMSPKRGPPDFWLHSGTTEVSTFEGDVEKREGKTHVAFYASSRKQVDEWYKIAM
jgi:hypothetical protein